MLGAWSYEVADTKLARKAKAGALLQMCVYSDLLAQVQGVQPPWMEVALGGSARAIERFRVADYMAYYRRARARFEALMADSPPAYPVTATYPEPVEHCEVCRWAVAVRPERRRDDHLSLVAGITHAAAAAARDHRRGHGGGAWRAAHPGPPPHRGHQRAGPGARPRAGTPPGGGPARRTGCCSSCSSRSRRSAAWRCCREPSPGDLFFDIEGDPFVEEGGSDGLEYLFGVIEPATSTAGRRFHAFWGTDRAAREGARSRSSSTSSWTAWTRDPDLHIYHYGAYEPSHVKTLMGRHATREDEVDRLLRGGVFVDLYRVVRQGVRVSQESYSIKKLEPLYGLTREVALKDAGSSIVNFEQWLDGGRARTRPLLDLIEAYNRTTASPTWQLRDWLEERRAERIADGNGRAAAGAAGGRAAAGAVSEQQAAVEALVRAPHRGPAAQPSERTPEQHATWLLAQLLDWHRREDKAIWWRYFDDAGDDRRGAAGRPGADRWRHATRASSATRSSRRSTATGSRRRRTTSGRAATVR